MADALLLRPRRRRGIGAVLSTAGLALSAMAADASAAGSPPATGTGYESFAARAYVGRPKPLSLRPGQRTFRTRLAEAYRNPINYGGSLVLTRIGCGSGCTFNYALDKSSGRALEFPLGGDDFSNLTLKFRKDSALVWASWGFGRDCKVQAWTLGRSGFAQLEDPRNIDCADAGRLLES